MTSKPEIRISKRMAKVKIGGLLDRGEEMEQQLSNVQAIRTDDEFNRIQDEYCRWSHDCVSLLTLYFEGDSLAAEYQKLPVGIIDDNHSFLDNKRTLVMDVERRVTWLSDLVTRLDDFPQSLRTPTGGWQD